MGNGSVVEHDGFGGVDYPSWPDTSGSISGNGGSGSCAYEDRSYL